MVRLVFRPYTQVGRTICTSVPRRTSTRVSPGFILLKYSSPSFGSLPLCSSSNLSAIERPGDGDAVRLTTSSFHSSISLRQRVLTLFDSHKGKTPRSVFQDG